MFRNSSFTIDAAVANHSGAMEADTISKNGRSSKSLMSRGNQYYVRAMKKVFLILAIFIGIGVGTNAQDAPPQNENPPTNTTFVLKKNSKIMINTYAIIIKSQSNTICKTLEEEFKKLGFCCVSRKIAKDEADLIIAVHPVFGGFTVHFFDKSLDKEVYSKTYMVFASIKKPVKKLVKDVTPFIEK